MIEAQAEDAEAVIALWRACGLTRPWNDPAADFARAVEGPTSAVLLRREGDALAASVMVGFDGHRGWVYYLAVAPGRRRAGSAGRRWRRPRPGSGARRAQAAADGPREQ